MLNLLSKLFHRQSNTGSTIYARELRRCIATLLDLLLLIIVIQTIGYISNFVLGYFTGIHGIPVAILEKYKLHANLMPQEIIIRNNFIHQYLMINILQLLTIIFFMTYMWYRFAATPGKMLLGIVVVDATTLQKITFAQAMKRFFAIGLSIAPLFLGILWTRFDKKKQAWHDKLANTVVILKSNMKR